MINCVRCEKNGWRQRTSAFSVTFVDEQQFPLCHACRTDICVEWLDANGFTTPPPLPKDAATEVGFLTTKGEHHDRQSKRA